MQNFEIFELEDIFLNKKPGNPVPSGQFIDSRPPAPENGSILDEWLSMDRKLIIALLILIFILGFIFAKTIS
ncbi:MAG: hypothetical protein BWY27_01118 [Bacteroidetes bacterium ADurb.Bin234]|nr:MAG: hypothetical protein BWY27_01118 [Bacteroidetes bacterium ADurb.Bin234]